MWDNSTTNEEFDFDKLLADLLASHIDAEKNKRSTLNTMQYETFSLQNTVQLARTIDDRTYAPSRGIAFINRDPVLREIFAAPFRDRVVHHYIYNKTIDWWTERFIKNTYSCLKKRGTLLAIEDVYKEMEEVSKGFTEEAYYIKMDLQGYFMSLNRKKLLARALRGLDEQYADNYGYEYETLRFLWRQIILDDPVRDAHFRNYPQDWRKLPKAKSLLNQPKGIGIVIGNLTSQELSNIYLNDFDWYVTKTLGWEAYNRYVDDFVIIVNKRDLPRALDDVKKIEFFLKGMGLKLHPNKREIQPIRHGLKFLGFRIYPGKNVNGEVRPGRIVPGERIRRNVLRAARQYSLNCLGGESLISYLGLLEHYDGGVLVEELFDIIYDEGDV